MDYFSNARESSKTYSEIIGSALKDVYVEIFIGEMFEQVHLTDASANIASVLYGKVIDGFGDCLIVDCYYLDEKNREIKNGNMVYLNGYNIKFISKLDGLGSIKDLMLHPNVSRRLAK